MGVLDVSRARQARFGIQLEQFVCATRPVRLMSLTLNRPSNGIRLLAYRVENRHIDLDYVQPPGSFRAGDSHVVAQPCDADHYSRVDIELERTRPGTQQFVGVRLTYLSDGQQETGYLGEAERFLDART